MLRQGGVRIYTSHAQAYTKAELSVRFGGSAFHLYASESQMLFGALLFAGAFCRFLLQKALPIFPHIKTSGISLGSFLYILRRKDLYLFLALFDSNRNSNGRTDHGVVAR